MEDQYSKSMMLSHPQAPSVLINRAVHCGRTNTDSWVYSGLNTSLMIGLSPTAFTTNHIWLVCRINVLDIKHTGHEVHMLELKGVVSYVRVSGALWSWPLSLSSRVCVCV